MFCGMRTKGSAAATSRYAGETARKLTASVSGSREEQGNGTFTANPETFYADIEEVDNGALARIALRDVTAADFVLEISFTFSTATAAIVSSGAGTAESIGAVKLDEIGPNGGPVYRVWGTVTPSNSGNTSQIWVYADTGGSLSTIYHAAQHVDAALFTSPVDGTRAAEQLEFARNFEPQEIAVYLKSIAGMEDNGGVTGARLWAIDEDATDPSLLSSLTAAGGVQLIYDNNVDAEVNATVTSVDPLPGDIIEQVAILRADGSARNIVRKNTGAVSAVAGSAPSSGLAATFDASVLVLNDRGDDGSKGAGTYAGLHIIKLSATHRAHDGTDDEGIMAEMAGLYISPDGKRLVTAAPFTELAVNGTFDSDLTGWTDPGGWTDGSAAWENYGLGYGGVLKIDQGATSEDHGIYQAVELLASKVYVLSGERLDNDNSTSKINVHSVAGSFVSTGDQVELLWSTTVNSVQKEKFTVSADGTYYLRVIDSGGVSDISRFDNVSLKEFDA